MENDIKILHSLQLPSKLTIAGGGDYDKVWIRDNVYVALALSEAGFRSEAAQIYTALLAIIKRYEKKLDRGSYPEGEYVLHPRFTVNGDEVPGVWSNKQHDAVGILLFGIGRHHEFDSSFLADEEKALVQKLVRYLENSRYWQDPDNGIWEEYPALHASSLAASIRGIEAVGGFCAYTPEYVELAKNNLAKLLPAESEAHATDLALLTLVWPLGYDKPQLVEQVESTLLRSRGVARYPGDRYEAGGHGEPEWVMGIPWLGVAHFELGDIDKARHYLRVTEGLYTDNGLPESYAGDYVCKHTPLGWSHAMTIVLRAKLATVNAV